MDNEIKPSGLLANGLWNIFTGKKKYIITCGKCKFDYTDKVIFNIRDTAKSICPNCRTINKWSHSGFQKIYDKQLEL